MLRTGFALVLLFGFACDTFAAERDYSLRVGFARSSVDTTIGNQGTPFEIDDHGLRLVLASPLTDSLGFEFGWTDFGYSHPGIIDTHRGSAAWVALTPSIVSGPWTLGGRIGVARTDLDLQYTPSGLSGEKAVTTQVLVGVSAAYRFNERWGTQLTLERTGDVATTASLEVAYHWRKEESPVAGGSGVELMVGNHWAGQSVDSFRYPLDATRDVILTEFDQPESGLALGVRVPWRPWLSFEFVYFPEATRNGFASGPIDPPPAFPPGAPGPPPPGGAVFDSTVEVSGMLLAARFEYDMHPDFGLFASVGALRSEESVTLRSFSSGILHRERTSETSPWLGVGLRYRVYKSWALTVEHGTAGDGGRSRAMLGRTF